MLSSSHFQKRFALLKRSAFLNYALGSFFAALGNGLGYIAMSWIVVSHYNNVESMAILMASFWGPNVILGPFMGVLADKLRRKTIITLATVIRGIIFIIFSIYIIYHFNIVLIYFMMICIGIAFSAFYSTASAFIRELVSPDDLMYANTMMDIAYEVGNVIGMSSAGLIIAWLSAENAILINGFTFLIAALFIFIIPKKALSHGKQYVKRKINIRQDFIDGLVYLRKQKQLMSIYMLQLLILMIFLTAPLLLVPFAKTVLHANVAQFGMIEALMSVGIVTGGILMPWFGEKYGFFRTVLFFSIVLFLVFLFFGYNTKIYLAGLFYCFIGFAGATWPLVISRAQNLTNIDFQGRVQSTFNSLSGVLMLIFYFSIGLIGKYFGVQHLYLIEVFIALIAILFLIKIKHVRSDF